MFAALARQSPGRRAMLLAGAAMLAAAGVAFAVLRAADLRPGADFHARWMAGRLFWSGEPLYVYERGIADPTYPPFAAMVFQLLALLPLKPAGALFTIVNLALIPVIVVQTRNLIQRLRPVSDARRWPLALAGLCTAQFFLNNLGLIQVNLALFALVLLGLTWHLDGRDVRAALALVGATAIKLVPVFLVVWLVIRGGRRALLGVAAAVVLFLALPIAQRGLTRGVQDLREYHATLLQGTLEGRVAASYMNQSLSAALYRITQPPQQPGDGDYRVLPATPATLRAVSVAAMGAIVLGLVGTLVGLRVRREPLSAFELSAAFLTGHLVSALTWRAHLVTLLFVLTAIFSIPPGTLSRGWRAAWVALIAAFLFIGLTGRDIVGTTLHHWIGGYSLIVWTLLATWAVTLVLSHARLRVARPGLPALPFASDAPSEDHPLGG
jgi:hypothetical protein